MELLELFIERMPGIDVPFRVAFQPGLNVVEGPNAAGKTSLVRAVRALLWPELERGRPMRVRATWRRGRDELLSERDGDLVHWQIGPARVAPPPLPEGHLAHCFTVTVDDLMASDGARGDDLAARVARQMAGGYDLDEIARTLFEVRKKDGQTEMTRLRQANRSLETLQREAALLQGEEEQLSSLREKLDLARAAEAERAVLEQALRYAEAKAERAEIEDRLASYPARMELLAGNEATKVAELEAERKRIEAACQKSQSACSAAAERLAQLAIGEGIDEAALARESERLRELRELGGTLARLREAARRTEATREAGLRAWHAAGGRGEPPAPTPQELDRAVMLLDRSDSLEQRRRELLARIKQGPFSGEELSTLLLGQSLLLRWLSLPQGDPPAFRRHRLGFALMVLIVAVGAIALAVVSDPTWLLLVAAAVIVWMHALQPSSRAQIARAGIEIDFLRTGLEPPEEWNAELVGEAFEQIAARIAAAEISKQEAILAEAARKELARTEPERDRLAAERAELSAPLGFQLESELSLVLCYRNLCELAEARREHIELGSALAGAERELEQGLARHRAFCAEIGARLPADLAEAHSGLEDLRRRQAQSLAARAELKAAERDLEQNRSRLEAQRKALELLLKEAGAGSQAELQARLHRLSSWKQDERRRIEVHGALTRLERELGAREDLRGLLPSEIRERIEQQAALAADKEICLRRIAEIETRVAEARSKHDIERALLERERARSALADKRASVLLREAGRFLLAEVDREHVRTARPRVMERAAALFAIFTHHAFELVLGEKRVDLGRSFHAIDTATRARLELDALSSGTRTQLLLAVRLAFAAEVESSAGMRLPVFLDEALAVTDAVRCRAIAESLLEVVRSEGRQVIYLTSRPELDVWRAAREAGEVHGIDLARLRRLSEAELPAFLLPTPVAAVPDPAGLSAQEYAALLLVPRFEPRSAAERVHLYYLLEGELLLLKRLIEARIETVGAFRALAQHGGAQALLSPSEQIRLEAWESLTRAFVDAWRVGRGTRVEAEDLERMGVSARYRADFAALLAEHRGDARAFVRALERREDPRAKGFRTSKLTELTDALARGGFLDEREPLAPEEIHARVLAAVAGKLRKAELNPGDVRRRVDWLLALSLERDAARKEPIPS